MKTAKRKNTKTNRRKYYRRRRYTTPSLLEMIVVEILNLLEMAISALVAILLEKALGKAQKRYAQRMT